MPKKDNRLIIYEKINNLIFYSKNLLQKFPKSERFDLCTDIKNELYNILRKVIWAWKEADIERKVRYLNEIDIELYVIKTMVRLSYEYKYITNKNYMNWNAQIEEIGKMVGGWIKSCQRGQVIFLKKSLNLIKC